MNKHEIIEKIINFLRDHWKEVCGIMGLVSSIFVIINWMDRNKNKKAKELADSTNIIEKYEDFDKWLNTKFIFDKETFHKREEIINGHIVIIFTVSLTEKKSIPKLFSTENWHKDGTVHIKKENYEPYQQEKAEKYRIEIREKWEEVERHLHKLGYESLKKVKFPKTSDKTRLESIEDNKKNALNVRDEILRMKN